MIYQLVILFFNLIFLAIAVFLNLNLRIASVTLQNSCGLDKLSEFIIMVEFLQEFLTFINSVFELVIYMPGYIPQRKVLLRDVIMVSTWWNVFRTARLSSMAAPLFWSNGGHQIVWKLSQIVVVLNRNLPLHSLVGGIRSIRNWFFFLRFVEFIGNLIFFLMWCMIRMTIIRPKIPPDVDIIWVHEIRIWHLSHEFLVFGSMSWLNAIIWNIFLVNEIWRNGCLRLVTVAIRMVFSPHLNVFS